MQIEFTHESYLALLAYLRELGYTVGSFHDVLRQQPDSYVIHRHDIDFSLARGVELAALDQQGGVTSTFFVLLTSPYFNVLSAEGTQQVRAIAAMGHEIGLHIDLTGFELLDPDAQQRQIRHLAAILGDVAGCVINSIAQHRPASTLVRVHSPGFIDAYDDRFYREIGYISDSRRVFVKPDVHGFFRQHTRSQLLTHPIWWTAEPATRTEIFERLGSGIAAELRAALMAEDARIEAKLKSLAQAG
jgi:hypothetical protein